MTRVLVTGAAGFIGTPTLPALRAAGHEVIGLARPGSTPAAAPHLRWVQADLNDPAAVRAAVAAAHPEACLHLAWDTTPGQYLTTANNLAHVRASLELLEALTAAGCRQFVGLGTSAEYAAPAEHPLLETSPLQPATLYAAAKIAVAQLAEQWCALHGLTFTWARLFLPYGPGDHAGRLIPGAIAALRAGRPFPATLGRQARDFIYAGDVGAALAALVTQRAAGCFNVCTGTPTPVADVLTALGKLFGRPDLIQLGARPQPAWDPPLLVGANARLVQLGWRPRVSLAAGLRLTAAGQSVSVPSISPAEVSA